MGSALQFKTDTDRETFKRFFQEVQQAVDSKQLRPMIRTQYNRTAFQVPFDATVRISLDTNLAMIKENTDGQPVGLLHRCSPLLLPLKDQQTPFSFHSCCTVTQVSFMALCCPQAGQVCCSSLDVVAQSWVSRKVSTMTHQCRSCACSEASQRCLQGCLTVLTKGKKPIWIVCVYAHAAHGHVLLIQQTYLCLH